MIQITNSSTVLAYGYDKNTKKLKVQFKGSGIYEYSNIDEDAYKLMTINTSVGKAIKDLVKGKEYKKL